MLPREQQRVYFANTPWWIPLGLVSLVGAAMIAAMLVRSNPPDQAQITAADPVRVELEQLVIAHRDGDDTSAQVAEGGQVTELDGQVVVGHASPSTEGLCWVVRYDTAEIDAVDGDTLVAGPLPGSWDKYCAELEG